MNTKQVNELIASLESAGELSIKERKYLDVMRWAIRVAGERDAALNAERVWERVMMEVCGEDGPASVANEIRSLRALRDTAMQVLKSQVGQLAAENVGLKAFGDTLFDMYKGLEISGGGIHDEQSVVCQQAALDAAMSAFEEIETPATDRIIAEAEAQGAEAYETALLTSDDDDFTYEASIFVEETHQQREVADK